MYSDIFYGGVSLGPGTGHIDRPGKNLPVWFDSALKKVFLTKKFASKTFSAYEN